MRLRDTVTSKWLKVDDLPGRERGHLDVTISNVGMSRFSDGRESVDLHFYEHPKPLGANATNRRRLMMLFGEDIELEQLIGHRIRLYAEMTQDPKGVPCWSVRIGPVPPELEMSTVAARAERAVPQPAAWPPMNHTGVSRVPGGELRSPGLDAARAARAERELREARPAQAAPQEFPRPMSHRPDVGPVRAAQAAEPAGFVDDADPGPGDEYGMGGKW